MYDTDICYKSCGDYIVTMKKLPDTVTNESRKDVVDPLHAKFRADKLLVVNIEHKITGKMIDRIQNTSYQNKHVWYEVSKEVSAPDYYQDLDEVCAPGIHYFLSRDAAYYWIFRIKDGLMRSWHDNGQIAEECTYVDGKEHGLYQSWHENGQKMNECTFVHGEEHGLYQSWYKNGQLEDEWTYVNGILNGLYQSWYENGQKMEECTYVDGEEHGLYRTWYETGQLEDECHYINGEWRV